MNISAHRKHTLPLLIFKEVNFQLNLLHLQFIIHGDCFKVLKEKWLLSSLEFNELYLTIIPRADVGYEMIANEARSTELAIIISYPTSASGIIVLLKTPPKYRKLDYNKNKKAQKITHMLAVFVDHGIMAHNP